MSDIEYVVGSILDEQIDEVNRFGATETGQNILSSLASQFDAKSLPEAVQAYVLSSHQACQQLLNLSPSIKSKEVLAFRLLSTSVVCKAKSISGRKVVIVSSATLWLCDAIAQSEMTLNLIDLVDIGEDQRERIKHSVQSHLQFLFIGALREPYVLRLASNETPQLRLLRVMMAKAAETFLFLHEIGHHELGHVSSLDNIAVEDDFASMSFEDMIASTEIDADNFAAQESDFFSRHNLPVIPTAYIFFSLLSSQQSWTGKVPKGYPSANERLRNLQRRLEDQTLLRYPIKVFERGYSKSRLAEHSEERAFTEYHASWHNALYEFAIHYSRKGRTPSANQLAAIHEWDDRFLIEPDFED